MQDLNKNGYNRTTKACRERYYHHISNKKSDTKELTEQDMRKLLRHIKVYGNKWADIAQKMGNRTSLEVKNNFYSTVRKIFRRLIKVACNTKNSNLILQKGTKMTWLIKPIIISSIFCNDQKNDPKLLVIDEQVKQLFKNLIISHNKVKITDQLDQKVIDDVKYIVNYLEQEKYSYSICSSVYLSQKVNDKIPQQSQSQILLNKIRNRKPVFTMANYRIEKNYKKAVELHQNSFNLIRQEIIYRDQHILSFASNYQSCMFTSNLSNYFVASNGIQQDQFYIDSFKSKGNFLY